MDFHFIMITINSTKAMALIWGYSRTYEAAQPSKIYLNIFVEAVGAGKKLLS